MFNTLEAPKNSGSNIFICKLILKAVEVGKDPILLITEDSQYQNFISLLSGTSGTQKDSLEDGVSELHNFVLSADPKDLVSFFSQAESLVKHQKTRTLIVDAPSLIPEIDYAELVDLCVQHNCEITIRVHDQSDLGDSYSRANLRYRLERYTQDGSHLMTNINTGEARIISYSNKELELIKG